MNLHVDAPAKINLFLDILRRREDGYHDLRTLFVAVDLADRLRVVARFDRTHDRPFEVTHLTVDGPYSGDCGPPESNLAVRAFEALAADLRMDGGWRLEVTLTKNIPVGAGLGGGSSDGAAALRLATELAHSAGSPPGPHQVHAAALRLGSDVPFFLGPEMAAIGEGRGDLLRPVAISRPLPLLLLKPSFSIATGEAYRRLEPGDLGERTDPTAVEAWLAGDTNGLPTLRNAFERPLSLPHPRLGELLEHLNLSGALAARLSGSGSALFGLFPDETARDRAAEASLQRMKSVSVWRTAALRQLPPVLSG